MLPPPHRVLFDEASIAARVDALARDIAAAVPDGDPLLVGLLDGSFVFVADLSRALARAGLDPVVHLMRASLYGDGREPGEAPSLLHEPAASLAGRSVLLVDDILDSGRTLAAARALLEGRGPAWLRTVVLLEKRTPRAATVEADFVGFTVPDEWIVGYGLDLAGRGRGLPYIASVPR